jgi:protein involved in plasmid replication-relaxation
VSDAVLTFQLAFEIDGRRELIEAGEDGALYVRRNGRRLRVADGVCPLPVGRRGETRVAGGILCSGDGIRIEQFLPPPRCCYPNRWRHEPWAPSDPWLESEDEYRLLKRQAAHPSAPPRLPAATFYWEDSGRPARRMALLDRELEVLRHLHQFRIETSSRLAWEFYRDCDRSRAQRRLKALAGYVRRGRFRVRRGSLPLIYALTKRGFEAARARYDAAALPYIPVDAKWQERVPGVIQAFEHDLRASGAIMELAGWIRSLEYEVEIGGPSQARVPVPTTFDRNRQRHVRIQLTTISTTLSVGGLRLGFEFRDIAPDGVLRLGEDESSRAEILVEFDRTGRPSKNIDKLRAYDSFLSAWWKYSDRLSGRRAPIVVFVCMSPAVVEGFLTAAGEQLVGRVRREQGRPDGFPGRWRTFFCCEDDLYNLDCAPRLWGYNQTGAVEVGVSDLLRLAGRLANLGSDVP